MPLLPILIFQLLRVIILFFVFPYLQQKLPHGHFSPFWFPSVSIPAFAHLFCTFRYPSKEHGSSRLELGRTCWWVFSSAVSCLELGHRANRIVAHRSMYYIVCSKIRARKGQQLTMTSILSQVLWSFLKQSICAHCVLKSDPLTA
jgi:hypothetical protein